MKQHRAYTFLPVDTFIPLALPTGRYFVDPSRIASVDGTVDLSASPPALPSSGVSGQLRSRGGRTLPEKPGARLPEGFLPGARLPEGPLLPGPRLPEGLLPTDQHQRFRGRPLRQGPGGEVAADQVQVFLVLLFHVLPTQ